MRRVLIARQVVLAQAHLMKNGKLHPPQVRTFCHSGVTYRRQVFSHHAVRGRQYVAPGNEGPAAEVFDVAGSIIL